MWRRVGRTRSIAVSSASVSVPSQRISLGKGRCCSTSPNREASGWGTPLFVLAGATCVGGAYLYFNPEMRASLGLGGSKEEKRNASSSQRELDQPKVDQLPQNSQQDSSGSFTYHEAQDKNTGHEEKEMTLMKKEDEQVGTEKEAKEGETEEEPEKEVSNRNATQIDEQHEQPQNILPPIDHESTPKEDSQENTTAEQIPHGDSESTIPPVLEMDLAKPIPSTTPEQQSETLNPDGSSQSSETVLDTSSPHAATPTVAKEKKIKPPNPYLQPSASPELFRDIFTMQKETYEKQLAEKDAKLARKLEKQRLLLQQQHEREIHQVTQEKQQEYEVLKQTLLAGYQEQIAKLQEERERLAEEAQTFIYLELKKLDEKKQAMMNKLQDMHASRIALAQDLQSKIQMYKQENLALSKSNVSVHTIFLALVDLSATLEQHSQPFAVQLQRLREAAKGEQVIEAAADSVSTLAERGVYSYDRLKLRFGQLQKHAYRAALVPPNGGMWWHGLSILLAATSVPPSLVNPQGEQIVDSLERASRHLDAGQLSEAIIEVENLHGIPRVMATDWLRAAKERLTLEQALRLITAELETMTVTHS